MTTAAIPITGAGSATTPAPKEAAHDHGLSFHEILSALNPLQYLPVVGTIYRALTGDVIPEPLRRIGSLVVSGVLGGPIGVLTSIAMTIAEKVTDIEPEKILTAVFHTGTPAVAAVPRDNPVAEAKRENAVAAMREPVPVSARELVPADQSASVGSPHTSASASLAMTPAQLTAYGVTSDASGNLRLGDVVGADVLNMLEVARHARATAAYATSQSRS